MSQQYHFKKGSLVEFLNTDAMQKRAEEASRIVNKEKGTNFAQEKARIEAENAAAAKKRPMTKYGYNMEPWEQKTEFINLALSKGAGTAEAHELWKAQQAYIEDPKAEGEARRQQRWLARNDWRGKGGIEYPNYGRRGRKAGYRKDPTFRQGW